MRLSFLLPIFLLGALSACSDKDRREERLKAAGSNPSLEDLMRVADVDQGKRKFAQCLACHSITQAGADLGGPNLFDVFGKAFGENRQGVYAYTAALRDTAGKWDAPTLDRWMVAPSQVVPGTKMQFSGVGDPLDRADLIAYMKQQSR